MTNGEDITIAPTRNYPMRITLKTLVIAAAVALPVVGTMTAGAVTAHAAKDKFERVKPHVSPIHRAHIKKLVHRRCLLSRRWIFVRERNRVRSWGYRRVRYAGFFQSRKRCEQVVRLTACRGHRKIAIKVLYRRGHRIGTHVAYRGLCYILRGPNRFKSTS